MSLISHSCAPNVLRFNNGATKQVWVVVRPIAGGTQILDSYGPFFEFQPGKERQEILREKYGFECQCEACVWDYPTTENLPEPSEVPFLECESFEVNLNRPDGQLRRFKEFLTKYQSHYPCVQLMLGMNRLGGWKDGCKY